MGFSQRQNPENEKNSGNLTQTGKLRRYGLFCVLQKA
jgi:hypothetical protein